MAVCSILTFELQDDWPQPSKLVAWRCMPASFLLILTKLVNVDRQHAATDNFHFSPLQIGYVGLGAYGIPMHKLDRVLPIAFEQR